MTIPARRTVLVSAVVVGIAAAAAGGFVWSGAYNVGADDAHTRPVHALLQTLRERSIEVRARQLQVPDLKDPARIGQGAGNYDAMCMGCHLAPGMAETEMSKGLYPAPPNLSKTAVDGAKAFWVIKHGIKASGMPAWGKSMDDEYIWNMAAFLQELPKLNADQYQTLVARSGGHSHGGGETMAHEHGASQLDGHHGGGNGEEHPRAAAAAESEPHEHGANRPSDHHGTAAAQVAEGATVHTHADGKQHVHKATRPASDTVTAPEPAPTTAATQPETSKGNEHEHHQH